MYIFDFNYGNSIVSIICSAGIESCSRESHSIRDNSIRSALNTYSCDKLHVIVTTGLITKNQINNDSILRNNFTNMLIEHFWLQEK